MFTEYEKFHADLYFCAENLQLFGTFGKPTCRGRPNKGTLQDTQIAFEFHLSFQKLREHQLVDSSFLLDECYRSF